MNHYAVVLLDVADENDNNPKFTSNNYIFSVKSTSQAGTQIGQVLASDADKDVILIFFSETKKFKSRETKLFVFCKNI